MRPLLETRMTELRRVSLILRSSAWALLTLEVAFRADIHCVPAVLLGLAAFVAGRRYPRLVIVELGAICCLAAGDPMAADLLVILGAAHAAFFDPFPTWLLALGVLAGSGAGHLCGGAAFDVVETALVASVCILAVRLLRCWIDRLEQDFETEIAEARATVADCSEIVETIVGEVVRFTADTATHMDEFASLHDDPAAAAFTARLDQVLLAGRLRETVDF